MRPRTHHHGPDLRLTPLRQRLRAAPRRAVALLALLLVAPLCAAACGVHVPAADLEAGVAMHGHGHAQEHAHGHAAAPAPVDPHGDCHGMAATAEPEGTSASGSGLTSTADCCDDDDVLRQLERSDLLADAPIAPALRLHPLPARLPTLRVGPPPEPGGRSPGRLRLLVTQSFLE